MTDPEDNEKTFNQILKELDDAINEAYNPNSAAYPQHVRDVYDDLADLAGLKHKAGNVFASKSNGLHFVRTRYGFQPAETFNKGIKIRELSILYRDISGQNEKLRYVTDMYIDKIKNYQELIMKLQTEIAYQTGQKLSRTKTVHHKINLADLIYAIKQNGKTLKKILEDKERPTKIHFEQSLSPSQALAISNAIREAKEVYDFICERHKTPVTHMYTEKIRSVIGTLYAILKNAL